jgi:uncharacterized protein with HEPN domain
MVEACEHAMAFASGREREDLESDVMLRMALARAVEIVGEAASKVSVQGRSELAALPWPEIVGMRHRIVHAYFDLNLDILWQSVQREMPTLLAQLHAVLEVD